MTQSLIPIVPEYRTSPPPLWPHVVPLCSWSIRVTLKILAGPSVDAINPQVVVNILRRRFHRGARLPGNLIVHLSDSKSIRAFGESCSSADFDAQLPYTVSTPGQLKLNAHSNVAEILDSLHKVATVLSTTELIDILKHYVFVTAPNVDRVSFINSILRLSRQV